VSVKGDIEIVDSAPTLNVSRVIERSDIYGPGLRSVIWVQGCDLACKGCWNTDLWPKDGGEKIQVDQLHKRLLSVKGVEGVTILGGEPLQQSPALLELLILQSEAGRGIMLYSGYEIDELDEIQKACVELADIAILGRYIEEERDTTLRWRGSSNQKITSPTGMFDESSIEDGENEVSVHIDSKGEITVIGYPDMETMLEVIGGLVEEI